LEPRKNRHIRKLNVEEGGRNDLHEISIEIVGRDALAVAARLELGGLVTKHVKYRPHSSRDSIIMERALKKLRK
jgi:hypothetical protein